MSAGMVFRSKIDAWLLWLVRIILLVSVAPIAIAALREPRAWAGAGLALLIVGVTAVFVEWTFHSTKYTIDGGLLQIRSGVFHWTVPIAEIQSMTPTRNPLSSPAASLDRLEIVYSDGKNILISPEERARFIEAMRAINPAIRT